MRRKDGVDTRGRGTEESRGGHLFRGGRFRSADSVRLVGVISRGTASAVSSVKVFTYVRGRTSLGDNHRRQASPIESRTDPRWPLLAHPQVNDSAAQRRDAAPRG